MVENYLVNPYTPGAGKMPKYLAGRKQILEEAFKLIAAIAYGFTARSVIYYGLRGVGKTVLLNEIEKMADEKKYSLRTHRDCRTIFIQTHYCFSDQ